MPNSCDQGDCKNIEQCNLFKLEQTNHQEVKNSLDQCEFRAPLEECLKAHKQSKSWEVRYGLLNELAHNDANVTMDDISQSNKTLRDIEKEKEMRMITDSSHQVNIMFDCNKCDAVYTFKIGLSRHIRSVHKKEKYDCNQCDYRATQQSNLTAHINSIHKGVK